MDLKEFGNNIRVERTRLRYSQEERGSLCGLQQSHVGKIERGESDIRVSTLVEILKALKVPFEKIYNINEE